jgi:RHS repeat-associated protein
VPAVYVLTSSGKERDTESGNDYFDARYFGSSMGRFLSPDPLGGHLELPQSLNKYAYVMNNPLIMTDPTGMDFAVTGCDSSDALHCQRNNDTGQYQYGSYGYDANGKLSFTATQVGDYGAGGSLADKNTGEAFSGSFDESGIHLTSASGNISGQGQFINGTNSVDMDGGGAFKGFSAIFFDDCGKTCVAKAAMYSSSDKTFPDLFKSMIKNPGLERFDFFHPGASNYHFDNGDGPSPHIPYTAGNFFQELHYDAVYPYADVGAFFQHVGSALTSIMHGITGPHNLPLSTVVPQ